MTIAPYGELTIDEFARQPPWKKGTVWLVVADPHRPSIFCLHKGSL